MQRALEEVLIIRKSVGCKRAAQSFNVQQSALKNRAKEVKQGMSVGGASQKG
jgi:hypothetical protein